MDQVEEVKGKIDIVQLIGEYLQLKKAGRNYKGLCPFHGEKTPSFMVNPELQIFKCFGCGEGGDAFAFVQRMEGLEFGEALKLLAKRVGVTLTSYRPTKGEETREKLIQIHDQATEYYHYLLMTHKIGTEAKKYLLGRGIKEETMKLYRLGFVPEGWEFLKTYLTKKKNYTPEDLERAGLVVPERRFDRFRNRVMFPLANHRGQVVGFAGRVMPGADEKAGGKYVNTPETEIYHKGDLLYGLNIHKTAIKTAGWVVVVEGEVDSIASYQAGVANTVAIKGSALTQKQVDLLKRYVETLVLALDADVAGDAASRRGIEIALKSGMNVKVVESQSETVNPQKYKDPGDWAIADPEGWKKAVEAAVPIYDFYLDSAVNRYGLDAIGKSRISREIIPIWVKIEDEIVKAHYTKRLAEVMGVGVEDVREQMRKVAGTGGMVQTAAPTINKKEEKSRREVMEEYVVGLALRSDKLEQFRDEVWEKGWIKTKFWMRVGEELVKAEGNNIKELVEKMPGELKERVEEVFLAQGENDEDKEWEKAMRELEELEIRERLKEIQGQIEEKSVGEEWVKLTKRLTELTK